MIRCPQWSVAPCPFWILDETLYTGLAAQFLAVLTSRALSYFNLIFQSLEVVSRYRDTQLQVTENVCDLWNVYPDIYHCFKIYQLLLQLLIKRQNVYCGRYQCSKGVFSGANPMVSSVRLGWVCYWCYTVLTWKLHILRPISTKSA